MLNILSVTTESRVPPSPALLRAVGHIERRFANRRGRAKSMARSMLRVGACHPAPQARYGDLARRLDNMQLGLGDALIHVRFAYMLERVPYNREILREAMLLLRWLRRHNPDSYYAVRETVAGRVYGLTGE